jgi:hypothetical protein
MAGFRARFRHGVTFGEGAPPPSVVGLTPELKRTLLRAASDHSSVSASIRRAIGEYLHVS